MPSLKPWREIRKESLLDCRIFSIERSVARSPEDDSEHDYFRILSRDWVQLIPLTRANEIVMVRQYRHGASEFVLEIPGGIVDAGEDPAVAAARECFEETGYRVDQVHSMGSLNPNPALHSHRLYAFFARDAVRAGQIQNTGTEQTEVELVPLDNLADLLRGGRIDHALVAATLWRFLHDHA
jgi:ADP-ribose pyrophosphatase